VTWPHEDWLASAKASHRHAADCDPLARALTGASVHPSHRGIAAANEDHDCCTRQLMIRVRCVDDHTRRKRFDAEGYNPAVRRDSILIFPVADIVGRVIPMING
jgi:hypothetical protein